MRGRLSDAAPPAALKINIFNNDLLKKRDQFGLFYIHPYKYVCAYTYVYTYMNEHIYMHISMYMKFFVCLRVCVYTYIYTYIYI